MTFGLFHARMEALAQELLLKVYKGDLRNKLNAEELVHWYGAFLILSQSFSRMFAEHGITPTQLDQIRAVATGVKTKAAKA